MGIGSNDFHPSAIEDHIYDILNEPDYIVSSEEYTEKCMNAVSDYLQSTGVQWNCIWGPYQDETGYNVAFAWVEVGHLHQIMLSCRKDGYC